MLRGFLVAAALATTGRTGAAAGRCEATFQPPVLTGAMRVDLYWSSAGTERCTLGCDRDARPVSVPTAGRRGFRDPGPLACRLECDPSVGGEPVRCAAKLEPQGDCRAPRCEARTLGSPERGFALAVRTGAERCAYLCDGFGAGTFDCAETVPFGAEPRACRVWALSDCNSAGFCTNAAWSTPIAVDGELGDWPDGTRFPTDQGSNHLSWDRDHLYLAVSSRALARDPVDAGVVLYLGAGDAGTRRALPIGSQRPALPVPMSRAWRFEPASGRITLWRVDSDGDWSRTGSPPPGAAGGLTPPRVASDLDTGVVEIAIPRAGVPVDSGATVRAHLNVVDATPGAETSYGATPYGSHQDGYVGAGRYYAEAVELDLDDLVPPNGSRIAEYLPDDGLVLRPLGSTRTSVRLATFNGGYVDVPRDESDVSDHVAAVCANIAGTATVSSFSGIMASIGLETLGFVLPPLVPDFPSMFATCESAVNIAIDVENDDLEAGMGGPLSHDQRADQLATRLLALDLDIIALNEIFVESVREELIDRLRGQYPYIVARIEHAADTDATELTEAHFGAYFVQDSGLMLFSRYPFLPLSRTLLLAPDDQVDLYVGGAPAANSQQQAVAFVPYLDACRGSDCNAGKGAALVRIDKDPLQRFAVVFTHLQATYGKDSDAERRENVDIRQRQLGEVHELIKLSLADVELEREDVFVLGDLNVVGRFVDGEELDAATWPEWDPSFLETHGRTKLDDAENRQWDQGRQEWLHHFCGLRGSAGDVCTNADPAGSHLDDPISPSFFACGDGEPPDCNSPGLPPYLVDGWAFDSSPRDLGPTQGLGALHETSAPCLPGENRLTTTLCSGERLDYILHNLPRSSDQDTPRTNRHSVCAQHMTMGWAVNGANHLASISDHFMVRGDFNSWWDHCRPREALDVALGADGGDFSHPGEIRFPGSMQWFRIVDPGSYSIQAEGEDGLEVSFMLYEDDDLTVPEHSYNRLETRWGVRYHLPSPPYYVRVFATRLGGAVADRTATGRYELEVHKHTCTSALDACVLPGGGVHQAVWPDRRFTAWPPGDPHNADGPDAQWFVVSTRLDDAGRTPRLSFEYEAECLDGYRFEIVEYCPPWGRCPGSHAVVVPGDGFDEGIDRLGCGDGCVVADELLRAESPVPPPAGGHDQYFLRILRSAPLAAGCTACESDPPCEAPRSERLAEARFGTTLTYFYPDTLELVASEDDAAGDDQDELWYFLEVDGDAPTRTCDGCAAGDPVPPSHSYQYLGEALEPGGVRLPAAKMGSRIYTENLQVNLYSEAEPGSFDTDEEWFVPRWVSKIARPEGWSVESQGLYPLASHTAGTGEGDVFIVYGDEDEPEEADYFARLRFCLSHEPMDREGPDGESTLLDLCRRYRSGAWGE